MLIPILALLISLGVVCVGSYTLVIHARGAADVSQGVEITYKFPWIATIRTKRIDAALVTLGLLVTALVVWLWVKEIHHEKMSVEGSVKLEGSKRNMNVFVGVLPSEEIWQGDVSPDSPSKFKLKVRKARTGSYVVWTHTVISTSADTPPTYAFTPNTLEVTDERGTINTVLRIPGQ